MLGRMLKFAWLGVMKNRRRTIITGLAVGVGLASMMYVEGLMNGMVGHMVNQTTDPWLGEGQIHRDGFRETNRIALTVDDPDSMKTLLDNDPDVSAYTCRIISPASLQSAMEMKPVTMIGVDISTDPGVTMLETAVDSGSYLAGESTDLVIGWKLADDLDADLGDVIVMTAADADSGLASSLFYVTGICRFGSDDLDRYSAFIDISTAGELLGLEGRFHEVALRLPDRAMGMDPSLPIWRRLSVLGNKAVGWAELSEQVSSMLSMVNVSMVIMAVILYGLVIFGIVNTLFMSVFERMYEFGVMKAVGTRPGTIATLVMLEAFWLGMVSMVLGTIIGLAILWITMKTGIEFGDIQVSGVIFDTPLYPVIVWGRMWIFPVATLALTALAGLYPGVHAGRLNPAEAMRKSL